MAAETIPRLLSERAAHDGQLEAIVGDGDRLTYAELDRRSAGRAAWLVARGVNKGHRVGLLMQNGVEWAVNAYAIMRIGAVLVPLSTLLRTPELSAQLRIAGVRHMIATRMFRGRNYRGEVATIERASLPSLRHIWWAGELGDDGTPEHSRVAASLSERVCAADDMVIIFTSGSSGTPKGVIHTHGGALRANAAGLDARCVRRGTRLYLPMPFFWVGGFAGGLISALNAGATLLTEAQPEPALTLRFLARERVTLFRGWPDQAVQIASHPAFATTELSTLAPGSLNALLPSGRRSRPGSRANLFGMTESFGPYCGYPLDRDMPDSHWGSCGQPFEGFEIRIVGADSDQLLPQGLIGNIQIRGRNILRGVCGREREELFTPDGWYDGGDKGWVDNEGFLYFAGRSDDLLKINGVTVYPSEVEAALQTIPGVQRAYVTGITLDGASALGAAVVANGPALLALDRLQCAAKERLSAFKLPARWLLVESMQQLPRTITGKIDKPALQALLPTQGQGR